MEISLRLKNRICPKIQAEIEEMSGLEFILNDFCEDDENPEDNYFQYYIGDDDEEDDCFPLERLLPVMGRIYRLHDEYLYLGIHDWGPWANGMIWRRDFSDYAISEEAMAHYKMNSDLFWSEAGLANK